MQFVIAILALLLLSAGASAQGRRRLALEGMHMLANNDRTSIAAPGEKVRRKTQKD